MKKFFKGLLITILICVIALVAINAFVILSTFTKIKDAPEVYDERPDCILVLGCGLSIDGTPSPMLQDRMDKAIELFWKGEADKLLLSGDNGQENYNEVKAMKEYAIKKGVPEDDIFLDHAGFSTYDSMYRAKNVFGVDTAIVVTQKYHEYRSIYIARRLGIDAHGVCAANNSYSGQRDREIREFFARDKDFVKAIIKPESKFLGDSIDITGSGKVSW